jgi:hypothetical protein
MHIKVIKKELLCEQPFSVLHSQFLIYFLLASLGRLVTASVLFTGSAERAKDEVVYLITVTVEAFFSVLMFCLWRHKKKVLPIFDDVTSIANNPMNKSACTFMGNDYFSCKN